MFYAARSGRIRTYLDEKARFARATGAFEHHVVVPGRRERHGDGRHELRSLELAASNGYRVPFGTGALKDTLRSVRPDVVILHDPFWRPHDVTREAHRLGARVVAVHHASPALNAAGLPGPDAVYVPLLKQIYRRAYARRRRGHVRRRPERGRRAVRHDPAALRPRPGLPPEAGRPRRPPPLRRPGRARQAGPRPARGDGPRRAAAAAVDRRRGARPRRGRVLRPASRADRRRALHPVRGRAGAAGVALPRGGLRRRPRPARDVRPRGPRGGRERGARRRGQLDPVGSRRGAACRAVRAQGRCGPGPRDRPRARHPGDGAAAAALSARLRWEEVFAAERADLERLLG